jgi:hypothetical protein
MIINIIFACLEKQILSKINDMKTYISGRNLILFGFVGFFMLSCSKKDNIMNPVVVPPVTQQNPTAVGAILDSGVVNSGTRVMKMALNTENFNLYSSNEEVSYASAKVKIAFYVNNDGLIPSGDYNFSNSAAKTPFTFDSGVLLYTVGNDSYNNSSDQIVAGTVSVSQNGKNYVFALQISLASGLTASQSYSGAIAYTDSQ